MGKGWGYWTVQWHLLGPGAHSSSPTLPTCQLPPVMSAPLLTWLLQQERVHETS